MCLWYMRMGRIYNGAQGHPGSDESFVNGQYCIYTERSSSADMNFPEVVCHPFRGQNPRLGWDISRRVSGCRARGTLKLRNFVGLVLSKSLKFDRISPIDRSKCGNLVSPWLQRNDTDWSPFSKVVHQLWSSGAIGPPGLGPSSSC